METKEIGAKKSLNITTILSWVCLGVIVLMIVLLFMPYWNYDGKSASILGFVGFPEADSALRDFLGTARKGPYVLNQEIITPLLLMAVAIITVVSQIRNFKSNAAAFLAIPFGAIGLWGYLTGATLKLGSLWTLHLGVCAVALVLGLATVVLKIIKD